MTASASAGWLRARLRLLIVLAILLTAGGAFAYKRLQPVAVGATPIVRGKAIDAVYATGTVEAEDRIQIKAKTNGSIAELLVKEGAPVKKGELLARIDNPAASFELKRGQAELSAASAQAGVSAPQIAALRSQAKALSAELELAKQDLSRAEKLGASGALTPADLDRARSRTAQLDASIGANQEQQRALRIDLSARAAGSAAQVQSLASRLSDTEVRAPMDGIVLGKLVEVGEVVAVNQTLFKVGDTKSLILEVSVDEADVARVRDGSSDRASATAVSLYAFPKQIYRGKVFELMPDANRERKAFLAKVRLDDPPAGMRSGMSAEVNIIVGEQDGALLAPSEAEADGALWVVRDGRARRQPVQVGVRDSLRIEVLDGVREGEPVVVEGLEKLEEGKRVAVTLRPADRLASMPDKSQPGRTSLR